MAPDNFHNSERFIFNMLRLRNEDRDRTKKVIMQLSTTSPTYNYERQKAILKFARKRQDSDRSEWSILMKFHRQGKSQYPIGCYGVWLARTEEELQYRAAIQGQTVNEMIFMNELGIREEKELHREMPRPVMQREAYAAWRAGWKGQSLE